MGKIKIGTTQAIGGVIGCTLGFVILAALLVLQVVGGYEFLTTAWPYLQDGMQHATTNEMLRDAIKLGLIGYAMSSWYLYSKLKNLTKGSDKA